MSIKLKITLFSSQDTSWPDPPVNCCRKKFNTFNTSSWKALQNQGFTISPFSIKETWLPTHREWVFGTLIHQLLGLQSFWIKFLFLAPTTQLLTCWITGLLSKENELGLSCTWQAPHCLLPARDTDAGAPWSQAQSGLTECSHPDGRPSRQDDFLNKATWASTIPTLCQVAASETYAEALGSEKRKKLPSSLRRDESLK